MNILSSSNQLITTLKPQIDALANYQFSIHNPLFWSALCVLFLLLTFFWEIKQSFSFCAIVACILIAATKLKTMLAHYALQSAGETFDPTIINVLCAVFISLILLYYIFIKKNR